MVILMIIHGVIAFIATKCNGHFGRGCHVFPQDLFVEAGSDAELVCVSACALGNVYWTFSGRPVNQSLTHRINSTHTALLLPSSLLLDTPYPSAAECHGEDNRLVLGGARVQSYTKPHNLSCILHSNHELKVGSPLLLTCRWEHILYSSPKPNVTYSVICDECAKGQREICSSDVTYCNHGVLNASIWSVENSVHVRAKTMNWQAQSSSYTFNASQIFKIPPRRVNVTAFPGQVLVTWGSLPNVGVSGRCQVKYEHTKEVLNVTLAPDEEGKITINRVESCLKYSVSVRCALDQAPWSDWSLERTVHTELKKSDVKLDVWRKVSRMLGQMHVNIRWKGVPPNCPGTLTYTICHVPAKALTHSTDYTSTLCGNCSCDIILNQEAHRVKLTVFYNGHILAEDSFRLSAFVEDEADSLFRVRDIDTKHELNGLVVLWTAPSHPVSGYVIDWTHNGSEFEWKRTGFTNSTLQGLTDKKPYNITVTPIFGWKTGPSTQISGVCSSYASPGNVTIDNLDASDTSAYVSWSIKNQESCSDRVENYTVFYSATNGPRLNVTVKSSILDVYLRGLTPGTLYSFHVVAGAGAGTSISSEGQFRTKLIAPWLVSILIIAGSILVIICLVSYCTFRRFYLQPVPNPGLSSIALWARAAETTITPTEPFTIPSECQCEHVCTEEMQETSIITNWTVISDQHRSTSVAQNNDRSCSHQRHARDSMLLLSSENSQINPYRSQSAADRAPRVSKQNKRLAMRFQEKTRSYVSLDMFDL